ncbi:MAG: hypothetical protein ACYS0E_06395 [Planctomycetota bacterium]
MRWLLLLLIFAGCKSKRPGSDDPLSGMTTQRRIMQGDPRGTDTGEAGAPAEWFVEQLRIIEREIAAGELEPALRRAFSVREKNPPQLYRIQLEQLIRRANAAVLGLDSLEAEFVVDEEPIEFGKPIRVRVRFRNVGRRPVRIPRKIEGSSESLFEVELVRRAWNTRAQVVTSTERFRVLLDHDWEIPAAGTAEQVLELGMFGNDSGLNGFRVYAVRGKLRAARLEIGDLRRWDSVPIRAVYLRSFRPNWKHLADDPLQRVKQALEKQAPTHLLTAAALLDIKDRQAAVDALVADLRGDRTIDWAIFGSLEYLTRIGLGRDANAWKAWWPRVRETYFDEQAERSGSGPAFEVGR